MTISRRYWQDRVNLYAAIQKVCTHPAYFWFNYKWVCHTVDNVAVKLNTLQAIERGCGSAIADILELTPEICQEYCNDVLSTPWNLSIPS